MASALLYSPGRGRLVATARLTARIPAGWRVIRRPLSGLASPGEAMALSSYPVRHIDTHTNCTPKSLIDQLPAQGAAIWILDNHNGPGHHLGRKGRAFFPPPPRRFKLDRRDFAGYECAGLSWKEDFSDRGHALYVNVYGHPARMSPSIKRQTLQVLDSLRVRQLSRLRFARPPRLGISCGRTSSLRSSVSCDQVALAVWPRHPAMQVDAFVAGRPIALRPPLSPRGPWIGDLHRAGLAHGTLAIPRRVWGKPSTALPRIEAPVRIVARAPTGAGAALGRPLRLKSTFHVLPR